MSRGMYAAPMNDLIKVSIRIYDEVSGIELAIKGNYQTI